MFIIRLHNLCATLWAFRSSVQAAMQTAATFTFKRRFSARGPLAGFGVACCGLKIGLKGRLGHCLSTICYLTETTNLVSWWITNLTYTLTTRMCLNRFAEVKFTVETEDGRRLCVFSLLFSDLRLTIFQWKAHDVLGRGKQYYAVRFNRNFWYELD